MQVFLRTRGIPGIFIILLTITIAFLAIACGDDEASESDGRGLQRVTVSTTWLLLPHFSPVVLAQERGYFAEEGLDVFVRQGGPGLALFEELNRGTFDFLFGASLDDLPEVVGQGMDIKAVAAVTHGTPAAIIVRGDSDIQDFHDLEGKTIGIEIGGGVHTAVVPDLLRDYGVDVDSIEFREIEARVRTALLIEGQIDAMTAHKTTAVEVEREVPAGVRTLPIADLGIDYLAGIGLMTSGRTIEERPDVVRAFVRALLRAWADAADNPQDSIDAAKKLYPEHYLDNDAALGQLQIQIDTTETPDTVVNGIGFMSEEEWQTLLDLLDRYTDVEGLLPPDSYYTNEFLPSEPIQLS